MWALLRLLLLLVSCSVAHAQQPLPWPPTLPPNSVIGRLGSGLPGPAQSVPISALGPILNINTIHIHQPVALATTTTLPAYIWTAGLNNGRLTGSAVGALSLDGIRVTVNARVLVKNEPNSGIACNGNVNAACNGIYTVTSVGDGSSPYVLDRSTALDSDGAAENVPGGWVGGDMVAVSGGSTNNGTIWANTVQVVTINLTPLAFVEFFTGPSNLWQINGSSLYFNTGNVGIGTAAPAALLQVAGLAQSAASKITGLVSCVSIISDVSGNLSCLTPAPADGVMSTNGAGAPQISTTLPAGLSIGTPSISGGNINGAAVTGLPAPAANTDAATKGYVDLNAAGLHIHQPVVRASTAPLPAYTWSAGPNGGRLTGNALGALSLDGSPVTISTRVLIKDELNSGILCNGNVNAACDGVYVVTTVGDAGTAYVLDRSVALDSQGLAENVAAGWAGGDTVAVSGGATNNGTVWANTAKIITINTTAFQFFEFSTGLNNLWQINGSAIYFNTGNVGIGTNTPGVPLQVVGTAQSTAQKVTGLVSCVSVVTDGSGNLSCLTPAPGNGVLSTTAGGAPQISTTLPSGLTVPNPTVTGTLGGAGVVPAAALAAGAASTNVGAVGGALSGALPSPSLAAINSGTVLANATAGSAAPTGTTATNWFDRAYCNFIGNLIVRFTGTWTCSRGIPMNVTWWGAVADSATDNTIAINNCIAQANANGGGTCYFPAAAGCYKVSLVPAQVYAILLTNNSVNLDGDGEYASSLCVLSAFSGEIVQVGDATHSPNSLYIRNIGFQNTITRGTAVPSGTAIFINNSFDLNINHVGIFDFRLGIDIESPIGLPGSYDTHIEHNTIARCIAQCVAIGQNSFFPITAGQPGTPQNVFMAYNEFSGPPGSVCLLVEGVGGLTLFWETGYTCGTGITTFPSVNQAVRSVTVIGGYGGPTHLYANGGYVWYVEFIDSQMMGNGGMSLGGTFTGSLNGTTLTANAGTVVGTLGVGATISGSGVTAGTKITAQTGGTAGADGTYTITPSNPVLGPISLNATAGFCYSKSAAGLDITPSAVSPLSMVGDVKVIGGQILFNCGRGALVSATTGLSGTLGSATDIRFENVHVAVNSLSPVGILGGGCNTGTPATCANGYDFFGGNGISVIGGNVGYDEVASQPGGSGITQQFGINLSGADFVICSGVDTRGNLSSGINGTAVHSLCTATGNF